MSLDLLAASCGRVDVSIAKLEMSKVQGRRQMEAESLSIIF